MSQNNFYKDQKKRMIDWRVRNILSTEEGFQNGKKYEHIVPRKLWKETLWNKEFSSQLVDYLIENKITAHTGTHNLLSSWVVSAILYFPIKYNSSIKNLMLRFLQQKISSEITELVDIELEFAFPEESALSPKTLLGESGGTRGSGQTSPDVVFFVKTKTGDGIILTECKYTEQSFYGCSARRIDTKKKRINNPDPKRCLVPALTCNYGDICHQTVWGRKYLSLISFSEKGREKLKHCPAAVNGYQLLRQQALAEGIAKNAEYNLVVSSVAFDKRNTTLIRSMRTTGINNFQTDWAEIFDGKTVFKTWTHQEWTQYVRENQKNGECSKWLEYVNGRYGY